MNPLITSHYPATPTPSESGSLITTIRWRSALSLIALALGFLVLSPIAQAVTPAPDGGYPGGNTAEGTDALLSLTSGVWNTALGFEALNRDAAGKQNTATGVRALFSDTVGNYNTATGVYALYANINGWYNNAIGAYALANNISGNRNTADGYGALCYNTKGEQNTATGFAALYRNTTGFFNTATGFNALNRNTTGANNTANGYQALLHNTTGDFNTANGFEALLLNTTGANNTANGYQALVSNTTGFGNIALGTFAGADVITANNVIAIGAGGANVSNSCFIGQIYSNVQPVIGIDPDYVTIDSAGRLGRSNLNASSRRYKHDIKPITKASEVIFTLKPVSFRYNKEYDATQRLTFGLIAEDMAEAAPDLVGRNKDGEPDSVRYDQINAMLLNELLKEHKKVDKLESTVASLAATVKEQAAQIQKVSARIEVRKCAPQVVLSNP